MRCPSKEGVKTFLVSTPIGKLELISCALGLHKLSFKEINKTSLIDKNEYDLTKNVFVIRNDENDEQNLPEPIVQTIDYLSSYFYYMDLKQTAPKICWPSICSKNSFTEKVLMTLFNKTKVGEKISYKQLAALSGNDLASRAVGSVMRRNQIILLIPCHRVIKTDESLGNYSGGSGVKLKKWLLEHELKLAKKQ